jgi:cytochrome c oxidase assembly protein subunit 19
MTRPPEKGVFPLDHDGECKPDMVSYLHCLKKNNVDYLPCQDLSKAYLACRMDKVQTLQASDSCIDAE